ncbi:MAG: neutral/alkaline non-lysosomal ceramidase N-terminal domain-containing protein [Armatimonadetes bacterium]|nr:neutral/alkaline non-lysosomal ceramidase N-terminal domain-containing protein [Armatimonadota bacterium]
MRFGVARDLITPPFMMNMGGYGTRRDQGFETIHDDLFVRALTLDDGQSRAALLTFDALFHERSFNDRLAEYAQAKHGVPPEQLVVSWTHSHAGPATADYDPGQESPEYEAFLWERSVACLDRAFLNGFEGSLSLGSVEGDWGMSRRKCVDGKFVNAPNYEADHDRTMDVLRLHSADGAERAVMLVWSCHPVTMGARMNLSGEFPGRLCQLVEAAMYGTQCLFFQSAGGDSRPSIVAAGDAWRTGDFGDVDQMSRAMAEAVEEGLRNACFAPVELSLAGRSFVVNLETETYPREFFEPYAASTDPASHSVWAQWTLDHYDTSEPVLPLHCGLVRLGDGVYVAHMGGEVTYEVKQVVQAALAPARVVFIGYTDCCAYVPGDRIIAEGGYEAEGSVVEYCLKGAIRPGVNAKVTAAFQTAARELP